MHIVLIAFGERLFTGMAYNLIMSLRAHGIDMPIHLYSDGLYIDNYPEIVASGVQVIPVDEQTTHYAGKLEPGLAKLKVFAEQKEAFMFIDVDTVCAGSKGIENFFHKAMSQPIWFKYSWLGYPWAFRKDHPMGGRRATEFYISHWAKETGHYYDDWCKPENLIAKDSQSSFVTSNGTQAAQDYFRVAYEIGRNLIDTGRSQTTWYNSLPDELPLTLATSTTQIIPHHIEETEKFRLLFAWQHLFDTRMYRKDTWLLSLPSARNKISQTLKDLYDELVRSARRHTGWPHRHAWVDKVVTGRRQNSITKRESVVA